VTRALLSLMILTVCVGPSVARAQESVSLPVAGLTGMWTDPKTGLMWATKDNGGSDTTYPQAVEYCQKLNVGGFRDWRLAKLQELRGIYDPHAASGTYLFNGNRYDLHIMGGIQLSGNGTWSSTPANTSTEGSVFNFLIGLQYAALQDHSHSLRALCVRGAGK